MVLPQNALLLISFGENIFRTISTKSNKPPRLDRIRAVTIQISQKGEKPNARGGEGQSLMSVSGNNG